MPYSAVACCAVRRRHTAVRATERPLGEGMASHVQTERRGYVPPLPGLFHAQVTASRRAVSGGDEAVRARFPSTYNVPGVSFAAGAGEQPAKRSKTAGGAQTLRYTKGQAELG